MCFKSINFLPFEGERTPLICPFQTGLTDMWYAEMGKPHKITDPRLVKAALSSLEVSWMGQGNAEAYLVQISRHSELGSGVF